MKISLLTTTLALLSATSTMAAGKVTTSKTWLSGATTIFARMTATGFSGISEQGLCYSTSGTPTIDSLTSKTFLTNNGRIYKISNLTPATVYYVRAYVKPTSGDVVYGETRKCVTRPGGSITYTLNGFSGDADTRMQAAAKEAVNYWNEYTGIKGLYLNINYGSGTPTADCSYGGYMRVGPSASYQATGTIMHEALHAIGVGTLSMWYSGGWMRGGSTSGAWRGVRVNRVVKFWDNDESATLKGDGTHMWPYGVNGAHEDKKTEVLYAGNSLLAGALGEDGLSPTSSQFAIPAYSFEQDDSTKYYIRNEKNGLTTCFLVDDGGSRLKWKELTTAEAAADDDAAWYITFDPSTCYYTLKNAGTGKYITYNASATNANLKFKTKKISSGVTTSTEKFHLMPSCVDAISSGSYSKQGYWLLHVTGNTATAMNATSSNNIGAASFSFLEDASAQRWVILTMDEVTEMETVTVTAAKDALNKLLAQIATLQAVGHEEVAVGADATLESTVATVKEQGEAATKAEEIDALTEQARAALYTWLGKVRPTDKANPFVLTFLIENADLAAATGWSASPTINYGCGEFYQKSFDFNQTLSNLPAGIYELKAQAFQRPGTTADVNTAWSAGTDNVNTYLYAGATEQKVNNIMVAARLTKIGTGTEVQAGSKYVPNDMQAAAAYFAKDLYDNTLTDTLSAQGDLKLGLKCSSYESNYWVIFDNFRLYYYGPSESADPSGIRTLKATDTTVKHAGIYTLDGTLVARDATKTATLPKGLYIVNGKKVIIK